MSSNRKPIPFFVPVPTDLLVALRQRLQNSVLPEQLDSVGWSYGTERSAMESMVAYWRDEFDWAKQAEEMNKFHHYKLECNGIDLHFIHEPSPNPDAIPLILIHGWPGLFWEFKHLVGPLSDPARWDPNNPHAQAFHVVVPSLPGFGFSSKPKQPGFNLTEISNTLNTLMLELGYNKYAAQGGDWGSIISRFLPQLHPAHCRAIHINMPPPIMPIPWTIWRPITSLRAFLGMAFGYQYFYSEREARDLADTGKFIKDESGYQALQGTKPQTLAYGLSDSPVGLLAWLLEKYHTWTEHSADSEALTAPNVTRDDILAIITTYYITSTISSSIRIYYEFLHSSDDLRLNRLYVKAPVGVALFKGELYKFPREWQECYANLKSYSYYEIGGHFAALEVPDLLIADIRRYFGQVAVSAELLDRDA